MNGTIHSPRLDNPVKVINTKFAIGGESPPADGRVFAVLKKGTMIVASAYGRRDYPDTGKRRWVVVFDLTHILDQVESGTYILAVYREKNNGDLQLVAGPVPGVTFRIHRLVQILYPDPNTTNSGFCFTPYGLVDGTGESLDWAKLYNGNQEVDAHDERDTDGDGFWWATFDTVNGAGPFTLKVQTNQLNGAEAPQLRFT